MSSLHIESTDSLIYMYRVYTLYNYVYVYEFAVVDLGSFIPSLLYPLFA